MKHSSIVQAYPQFVADQVLTQDQLNSMRNFLDSQNRATRVKLVGIGIVCGLHAHLGTVEIVEKDVAGNVIQTKQLPSITVSEGYGVTSDGWLICIPEKKYAYIQPYTDPDVDENGKPFYRHWRTSYPNDQENGANNNQIEIQRLLEQEDAINGSSPLIIDADDTKNQFAGKALLLYLEINKRELKSCFTTDCNNKGQSIDLEVEVLLVDKDQRFLPGNTKCNELEPLQHIPRWSTALQVNFNGKQVPAVTAANEINGSYQHICDHVVPELISKINKFYTENEQLFCFSEYQPLFSNVDSQLQKLVSDQNIHQYKYDILKDIVQAYNECVEQACKVLKVCCSEEYFPRHLVIRDFDVNDLVKTKDWRTPFYPSAVENVMHHNFEKVRLLFARLLDLVNNFTSSTSLPEDIKITPSHSELYPLAERAIPFYFDGIVGNTWQLDACCNKPSLGYHWNDHTNALAISYGAYRQRPLHYNLNAASFLRIEGHLGSDSLAAKSDIEALRQLYHLDFQVVNLPLVTTFSFTPPSDNIIKIYEEIVGKWKELFVKIEDGSLKDQEYQGFLKEISELQSKIETDNKEWCNNQINVNFACDFSNLQADYSILRAELLCLLHKCKPVFNDLPEIEFEEEDVDPGRRVCTDFQDLSPNESYGAEVKNKPGDPVFEQNGIKVSVHEFNHGGTNPLTFGNASVVEIDNARDKYISVNNINFKFDLNASQIGFSTNKIEFIYSDFGGENNIGVDGLSPVRLKFNDFVDEVSPIPFMPGYTLEVNKLINSENENKFRGTLSGIGSQQIKSVTIGGQEFQLFEVCAIGDSTGGGLVPVELPSYTFESRFDRIRFICDLLVKTMHPDIRCFNFLLFQQLIKDFAGAAIEVKIWLHCIFKSVEGQFLPYNFYPEWNDFEDCLDHIHSNCLYPRFAALAAIFEQTISANQPTTLGSFTRKYPGAEHMAGVPKGGTFILVYEDENNKEVIADFSLSHFVDDCCTCEVDMKNIKFPAVALADYRIVEVSDQGTKVQLDIAVMENDFSLDGRNPPKLSSPGRKLKSDKGADLTFDTNLGIITYEWNEVKLGVDHFTYTINNGHSEDVGHVYIGICRENEDQKNKATVTGKVYRSGTETSIIGANIEVKDGSGRIILNTQMQEQGFYFSVPTGKYNLNISYPNYSSIDSSFENKMELDVLDLGIFYLSVILIRGDRQNVYKGELEALDTLKISDNTEYILTKRFALETASDDEVSITKVSNAYKKVTAEILVNMPAEGPERNGYISLLDVVDRAYMDRVIIHDSEKPNAPALKNIKATEKTLKEKGISRKNMIVNWNPGQLGNIVGDKTATVDAIKKIFQSDS